MEHVVLDYRFTEVSGDTRGGGFPYAFQSASIVTGPGDTPLGRITRAVDLRNNGKARIPVTGLPVNRRQFCIRVVFRVTAAPAARQNLAESSLLPFALYVDKGESVSEFVLAAAVKPAAHGWFSASTRFRKVLPVDQWHTATLAYDVDTVAILVGDELVSVQAFPNGLILTEADAHLYIGTAPDGSGQQFPGQIAGLEWYAGLPAIFEQQLDVQRSLPEWFISRKYAAINHSVGLGERSQNYSYSSTTGAYLQPYVGGAIVYHPSVGAAFEMHGSIHAAYMALPDNARLGYLVSDEIATAAGGGSKNLFSRGGIYRATDTGPAVPVLGTLYTEYEALGEVGAIGFPTSAETLVQNGREQVFQHGRMYLRNGGNPKVVRGPILQKLLELGLAKCGFPTTHELDVVKGGTLVGKQSEFERGSIYWSGGTGAHFIWGPVRERYLDLKGPLGDCGFPTSDELAIPGAAASSRFWTFERGSILQFGPKEVVVAHPFRVRIARIDTEESEPWGAGQNDLYCYVEVKVGSTKVYDKRWPSAGDWGGNVRDVNTTIPYLINPNNTKTVTFSVDVYDSDVGGDDHLGKWTKTVRPDNAWGFRNTDGVFRSGSFSKIDEITASLVPDVDPDSLTETQKFWGVENQGTDTISESSYAAAFRDIDADGEWYDPDDWLEEAFYNLVVDDLADAGNCYGMCLEAIYARKQASLFGLPLDRFTSWRIVEKEFNIKHCYQVGDESIWWFVDQFLTGNTRDPKDVFERSNAAFDNGHRPIFCVAQNWDFSGAPHAILPVSWTKEAGSWKVTILDPNYPLELRTLTVDPDSNEFEYLGESRYHGAAWSGGRLHYVPFSVLDRRPETPIWDAIMLLLSGTVLVIGDDAKTLTITDPEGNDLDAFSEAATQLQREGRMPPDCFVRAQGVSHRPIPVHPVPGVIDPLRPTRANPIRGELWLRRQAPLHPGIRTPRMAAVRPDGSIMDLVRASGDQQLLDALARDSGLSDTLARINLPQLRRNADLRVRLDATVPGVVQRFSSILGPERDFSQKMVGVRAGTFRYALKRPLGGVYVKCPIEHGEQTDVRVTGVNTRDQMIRLNANRRKDVTLKIASKLGVGGERVRVTIDNAPVDQDRPIDIVAHPGVGGVEILAPAGAAMLNVRVEVTGGRQRTAATYDVPVDGGVRLDLAAALHGNELNAWRIQEPMGAGTVRQQIQPR